MVEKDKETKDFCAAVGELILWTSAIDSQLTKAVILICPLPKHPMLEPVISEITFLAKCGILRSRSNHINNSTWSKQIKNWTKKAEKINGYRNTTAHHQLTFENEKPVLFSAQATKLLKRIDGSSVQPPKTIDDIHQWIEKAKEAFTQGNNVLSNLEQFAEKVAKHQSK